MTTTPIMLIALGWDSPALSATTHGRTSYEGPIDRWHMLCADGTRALRGYNCILNHWNTTITASPRKVCTGRMHPFTKQVDVRLR
jgi:hypothetical protein